MCDESVENSDDYLHKPNDEKIKKKSSYDKSSCHASTSRGLSHSSGDCDTGDSSSDSSTPQNTKPCTIADSYTLVHKSKWKSFKKYITARLKVKRKSGSKCGGSDFSIERILSDDIRSRREESAEVPEWLCCTRYRPPRLPRAASVNRVRRAGRHARVPFTAAQASALEAAYSRAPYLAPPALKALAAALQLRDDRIKIWFQNRRARERREKSSTITPPLAVTLPPTTISSSINTWNQISRNIYAVPTVQSTSDFKQEENFEESDEERPETPLDVETV